MNKRLLEGEVLPAKIFHEMLCKDSQFQQGIKFYFVLFFDFFSNLIFKK